MKKQSLGSVFAKVSVYLLFLMLVNLSVYSVWASALMCIFAPGVCSVYGLRARQVAGVFCFAFGSFL